MFSDISPRSIGNLSKLEFLRIGSNNFQGIITEAHMFNLSRLRWLNLSSLKVKFSPEWVPPFQLLVLDLRNCSLGPHFPWWLKTQKQLLYVDISSAGISEIIPSWFLDVATNKCVYMNSSNNQLYGVLPHFSFSTINSSTLPQRDMVLDFSRNKIGGSITFLCKTTDFILLDLSDNCFFDQIPDCFANFERLRYLNLANNHFFGKIPYWFGSLSALSLLHLRNNNFSGELPISMGNCTELEMIDLGENRLTGKIPTWIGDRLSELKVLVLRFNEFYGRLPSNLCGLADIQILDLSSNRISGVIPNCMHKYTSMTQIGYDSSWSVPKNWLAVPWYPLYAWVILRKEIKSLQSAYFMWKGKELKYTNNLGLVRLIDLSSNNLSGEIPSKITKLVGLIGLNFSTNNMTGSIPHDIGQLKLLDFLDLSRNQLSGHIPNSLGELSFLGFLNLSCNNLFGRIPPSNKLSTFDESFYMGNSGLCGFPLNKSCPEDQSDQDSDSNVDGKEMRKGESEDDEFITEGFYVALALGFIIGFVGIFGTILFNKATQHAFLKVLNIVGDFVYVRMELSKARFLRSFQNQ